MTDHITLRRAAEQALEALEDIGDEWGFTSERTVPKRRRAITALRAALDEPVQKPQGCDYCNHPLYAGINCRVCGRVTEPGQEPVPRLITTEPWGWLNPPYGELQRNLAVKATWASTAAVNPPFPLYLGHPEDNDEP